MFFQVSARRLYRRDWAPLLTEEGQGEVKTA